MLLAVGLCCPGTAWAKPSAPKKPVHQRGQQAKPAPKKSKAKPARAAEHTEPPSEKPHHAAQADLDRLALGYRQFQAADYATARATLAPLADGSAAHLLNHDLVLYLLASSEALELPRLPTDRREDALAHFEALSHLRASRYAPAARARAADLLYDLGRADEARAAYRALLAHGLPKSVADTLDDTVARFRLAELARNEGARDQALDGYRRVYTEHPEHPLADLALSRCQGLDPSCAITPEERVARAERLRMGHDWQQALDELARLPREISQALRDEADYQAGMTRFRMRRGYDVAAEKLLGVWPRLSGARRTLAFFLGARAWSRADQDDRAIAGYRALIERFPEARQAPEAAFLIGWLDFNRGRYREALPGLEHCARRYRRSPFGAEARWYLGLSKWLLGDVQGALAEFSWLARQPGALVGGKGAYWQGRALAQLGRAGEAQALWRKLAGQYPFSYYAQQARVRLAEKGVKLGPFGVEPAAAGMERPGKVDERLARDPAVARVDELLRAGLSREAAQELTRVARSLQTKYGSARALPLLLDRYDAAEDWSHAYRLAAAHAGPALRRDPRRDPAARAWWKLAYPLAYRKLVERYAEQNGNPPYYLYAIMQKESAYNPHDRSYADAIGLLQMIPPTSRRVAERLGKTYTDDLLYDPAGNIELGAWYIGHLLRKFKGQVALGAGSFNAGPRAMMGWLDANGARPLDEFIELCPYTQTREYMKKVLEIYARYLYLYEGTDYLPQETIDAAYLKNDLDY